MAYAIQIKNCKNQTGGVRIPDNKAYDTFATLADLLMLGEDLGVDLPGATPGAHYDQVTLVFTHDLSSKSIMVSSVFLLCECHVEINNQEQATSSLLLPTGVKS